MHKHRCRDSIELFSKKKRKTKQQNHSHEEKRMFPFRKKREEERIAYLVTRGGNNHFAVNSSFRRIRLIHSASIEPKGKNCPGNGGGQGTDGDIFARDREARGRGGGSLCLFRSAFTSRLYFLSPSSSSPSLVFGVLSASVAASCFLFCHRYLPPLRSR